MNPTPSVDPDGPVYRIDKFDVPAESLNEFMDRVRRIQHHLGTLAGCSQNLVLAQTSGPGRFNVLTFVEWANSRAMTNARTLVQEHYQHEGFDPEAFMAALGVQADLGVYTPAIAS